MKGGRTATWELQGHSNVYITCLAQKNQADYVYNALHMWLLLVNQWSQVLYPIPHSAASFLFWLETEALLRSAGTFWLSADF